MVNNKIRLIIFFAAKDGETLYSQQKQDGEVAVAQIMNSLLQNSGFSWSRENHKAIHVQPKSNPLWLHSGGNEQIEGIRSGS